MGGGPLSSNVPRVAGHRSQEWTFRMKDHIADQLEKNKFRTMFFKMSILSGKGGCLSPSLKGSPTFPTRCSCDPTQWTRSFQQRTPRACLLRFLICLQHDCSSTAFCSMASSCQSRETGDLTWVLCVGTEGRQEACGCLAFWRS